jgi:hypothetical protein
MADNWLLIELNGESQKLSLKASLRRTRLKSKLFVMVWKYSHQVNGIGSVTLNPLS